MNIIYKFIISKYNSISMKQKSISDMCQTGKTTASTRVFIPQTSVSRLRGGLNAGCPKTARALQH